ncbi:DUF393 domain-containing protein [Aliiglaciecola litoralis]|uniref:DUF393 domain-containing protein n=2 Tax=Aliiglaciecola litoralis TaxID=582857 RepID=A0ABP3WNJ0_9ALTE
MIEMRKLHSLDKQQNLNLVDIHSSEFDSQYPMFDKQQLDARIHGLLEDGTIVTGLDATYHAWQRVGKGWVYAPLRWPVIRWFADLGYRLFARYRHSLSYLLTKQARCQSCIPSSLASQRSKPAKTERTKSSK